MELKSRSLARHKVDDESTAGQRITVVPHFFITSLSDDDAFLFAPVRD